MSSARLHVVTNDEVSERPDFISHATSILDACRDNVALHIRLKRATATRLYEITQLLTAIAMDTGSMVVVNERFDVALAAEAQGVHVGMRSIPMSAIRRRAPALRIGYSAHTAAEARQASGDGADFLFLGTIWPSGTHPGECTAGLSLISESSDVVTSPIYAIGGVTPSRSQEALLAGAYGVAVISGIWDTEAPAAAAAEYLKAMRAIS